MRFDDVKLRSLKRMFFVLALILVVGVSVTGCMNNDAQENDRGVNENGVNQPSPSPDYMPQGTAVDSGVNGNAGGAGNAGSAGYDWTKGAAEVEGRIAQISEISEARVVVEGNTALVAVRFNQAYQGEMTERIREMIAAEVMKADANITTVAVTADNDDVEDVYEISDRMLSGMAMDDLKEDIGEIVRNATTLR